MALIAFIVAALCAVDAAPPSQTYHHSVQFQQLNPLDYYLDTSELGYYQHEQKREKLNSPSNSPARLETLEPDDEVELVPGVQPPQQPPQQTPVAPNIPGLIPGRRVFIIHMPVPGIRPGTIAGYQPVYVVGAAPQGNAPYPGYQNGVLVNPSGQPVSPHIGYPMQGPQGNPNLIFGTPGYNNPFGYQQPYVNYQQSPTQQAGGVYPSSFSLKQLVSLQGQQLPAVESRPIEQSSNAETKSASLTITDSKEETEETGSVKSSQGITKTKV